MIDSEPSSVPAVDMTPPILASGVEFAFGTGDLTKQVLFDVRFSIAAGEILLLTGPSGSGKTTLLTLIGALRTLKHGSLKVLGREMHEASRQVQLEIRRRIGFIFQAHNLLPHLTARENVQLMLQLRPEISPEEGRARASDELKAVGLGDRLDYHPGRLSGGQRQRVAVARALVGEPSLVLADEPTAALDSRSGREVVDLLTGLAREKNCPILMVTHDSRVFDVADRIIRMEDGRIIDDAAVDAETFARLEKEKDF